MIYPWNGKGGWVWYVSQCGTVDQMIAQAKAAGLDYLIIKYSDGDGYGDQQNRSIFHDQFVSSIGKVKAAGLGCLAYSYVYGGAPSASPEAEAFIVSTAASAGADAIVLDAEYEYINRLDAAARFFDALVSRLPSGFRIALSTDLRILCGNCDPPWSATSVDLQSEPWPWATFFQHCQAVMFQAYFDDFETTPAGTFALLSALGNAERSQGWAVPEIIPTLPSNANSADLADALGLCSSLGVSGVNFWRLDTLGAAQRAVVAKWVSEDGEMSEEEKATLLEHLNILWGEAEATKAVVADLQNQIVTLANAAAGTEQRIVAMKNVLGLNS